jgi:hypothetical protein
MKDQIKKSKNQPTIQQLILLCRHIDEMEKIGMTRNHSIRLLELTADVYAKLLKGGSASPHSAGQVGLWSVAAKKAKRVHPKMRNGEYLIVEHGTPRRAFALRVFNDLYLRDKLNEVEMNKLVRKYWKLAVITKEEDHMLTKIARSKMYSSPEKRWATAGIKFK